MTPSESQLEDLLATKDYADLTPQERVLVDGQIGKVAYDSERMLRVRTAAALAASPVPADPGGWAAVARRTRTRRGQVPWWGAAAAVLLAACLTWWGRTASVEPAEKETEWLVVRDTLWQEVRVVDTVYLPMDAPKKEPPRRRVQRRKPVSSPVKRSPELEAAMAAMPAPEVTGKSGGNAMEDWVPPETGFSDKLIGQ